MSALTHGDLISTSDGLELVPDFLRAWLHDWFDVHGPIARLPLEPHPHELPRARCLYCGHEAYLDTDEHLFL